MARQPTGMQRDPVPGQPLHPRHRGIVVHVRVVLGLLLQDGEQADRRLVVTRAGRRIGQAAVTVAPGLSIGTHAYVLLEGQGEGRNPVLPERPARRWMAIDLMNAGDDEHVVRAAIEDGRLTVPKRVAMEIDTLLRPGATVVLTDEPIGDEVQRQQIDVETVVPPAS